MKRTIMSLVLAGALVLGVTSNQAKANEMDRTIGTLIGAVGGGLLGSTLGKGKGRIVATAAGTIFGAVLGREVASNNDVYDRDDTYRRDRVVYKREPVYKERRNKKVVYVESRKPRHKKNKHWKRVARYGDDILVCNKNGKRCQWYD